MVEIGKGDVEAGDRLHDQQLLRELDMINARTRDELGLLPLSGLPVIAKRKPVLPRRGPARPDPVLRHDATVDTVPPSSVLIREAPQSPEGEPMSFLDTLLGRNVETEAITYANCAYHREHPPTMSEAEVQAYSDQVLRDALVNMPNFDKYVEKHGMPKLWPLRFRNFAFGGEAFNVKMCRVIYGNNFFNEWKELQPSPAPDWLHDPNIGWVNSYLPFPKLDVHWTSLDGNAHEVILDLEKMLRKREVLTKVRIDEIPENWLIGERDEGNTDVDLLLEINDRTLRLYMKATIAIKIERPTEQHRHDFRRDWMLAWTKDY